MASEYPSLLSLSAAVVYLVIVAACLFAARTAFRFRQPPAHWKIWVAIALVFALLAGLRAMGAEEALRDALRDTLRSGGLYAQRRDIQLPIAVIAVLSGTALGALVLGLLSRRLRGMREFTLFGATAAVMGMALLMTLRIISLHQIDVLLYGPLKLNWVGDIGISLTVLAMAALYVRRVRMRR